MHFAIPALAQKLSLYDLKVEYQDNPLSVEANQPRFSWKLNTAVKNTLQKSYEIRVGQDAKSLAAGKAILWKDAQSSEQSVHINYAGPALQSRTRYFWQVRIKDNHGNATSWSEVKFWQMGIKPEDWSAQWISVPTQDTSHKSPLFRKEVSIDKKIQQATAYITAKGLYEAAVNGKKLGDAYFAPGWTSYAKRLQFQTYDVTEALKKGNNVLAVTLGDGWYKGHIGFGHQTNTYGNTRALCCKLK